MISVVSTHAIVTPTIEIGQRTLRVFVIFFAVIFLAGIADMLAGVLYSKSLFERRWLDVLGASMAVSGLGVVLVPASAFLIHTFAHRGAPLTRDLQRAALLSAVSPAVAGLWLVTSGEGTLAAIAGAVMIALAIAVAIRALTAPRLETGSPQFVLRYRASFLGIVLVVIALTAQPHEGPKPYITAMKSDLRNLAEAEEAYFSANKRYVTDLSAVGFRPSRGVDTPRVQVGPGWWRATASHSQLSGIICGIALNTTNPVVASTERGEPACADTATNRRP
jgi:hypothetical protein